MSKKLYSEIYSNATQWHKSHLNPQTDEDWYRIIDDMSVFDDSEFERALCVAIVEELTRVYKSQQG